MLDWVIGVASHYHDVRLSWMLMGLGWHPPVLNYWVGLPVQWPRLTVSVMPCYEAAAAPIDDGGTS